MEKKCGHALESLHLLRLFPGEATELISERLLDLHPDDTVPEIEELVAALVQASRQRRST
jgi:hypothetical protein